MVQVERNVFGISRFGATVISTRSTLQPSKPARANVRPIGMDSHGVSGWPIGINLIGVENPPMGTSPVARLGVIQVARGKHDTVVVMTGGAPLHTPHYSGPPPPPPSLKVEWQGGSGIHWEAVDHDE
jgi:hypothetical protein